VRRIAALTYLLLLIVSGLSFVSALARTSNSPVGVRAVEWLRDNGAAGFVASIERLYYTWNAPPTGGPPLKALPSVGTRARVTGQTVTADYPPPISLVIRPALPGEGVWRGAGPLVRGAPPILVTTFRPDPDYPQMVAGVAWIDTSRTWLELYPGRSQPPNSGNASAEVPVRLRGRLLATFNSGFKLQDDHGGFVAFGHLFAPLQREQATFIRLTDGTVDIRAWTGTAIPPPSIGFARQNLPLIVRGGQLNPNLSDTPAWGATLGNSVRVWRSGVGIDAHGNLIYAAADAQTAASLARILQRVGAVRAMELDINYEWTTFNFYGGWGASKPQKRLPGMNRDATRYLTPDDRDFFAVYARPGG
jgi:Phosphodiester glycosidase